MKIKNIEYSPIFKRGVKRAKKKHFKLKKLEKVVRLIVSGEVEKLTREYRDHALQGSLQGLRELHFEKDWLLAYRIVDEELTLYLLATGSHDDVFRDTQK